MYNTTINAQLLKRVKNKVLFQQELKDLAMSMSKFKTKLPNNQTRLSLMVSIFIAAFVSLLPMSWKLFTCSSSSKLPSNSSSFMKQMLCRVQATMTTLAISSKLSTSIKFSRRNLPFSIPNALSITILALECMKLYWRSARVRWPLSRSGVSSQSIRGYAESPRMCLSFGKSWLGVRETSKKRGEFLRTFASWTLPGHQALRSINFRSSLQTACKFMECQPFPLM